LNGRYPGYMRFRLIGEYVHVSIAVLAVVELVVCGSAFVLAANVRFGADLTAFEDVFGPLWPRALVFSVVMVLCLLAFGLYSARQRARAFGVVLRVAAAMVAGVAVTAVVWYIVPALQVGRGVMILAFAASIVAVTLTRTVFARLVDENVFKRRVLVYGSGQGAATIAELRRRSDRRGFVLVGFVKVDGETHALPVSALDPSLGLFDLCVRHGVDEIVVAMDDRRRNFPLRELLECRLAGVDVTELLTFLERETGRVRLNVLNPSWLIFGPGFRRDPMRLFSSRALDVVASVLILTVSLPVILLSALAILIEDGWHAPVFYRQARVGRAGRLFELLKFRSMRSDAETDGMARWAEKDDPRVSRVGGVMRKMRIDELPQLLNVLRGHMSLVGPRPERPHFVTQLAQKIPYYVERHCVKPGITGWAQLCYPYGSSEQDAIEKLQYDLYYIKNNSFLFDLSILLQTVEVVFMRKGAR
jgi:sugar transferase (PEP-CTERM system associated)